METIEEQYKKLQDIVNKNKKKQNEASKRYNDKNKDKLNEYKRVKYEQKKDDENFKLKNRERTRKFRALQREKFNELLNAQTFELFE